MGFKASVTLSKKREQLLGYTLVSFHDEGNEFRWKRVWSDFNQYDGSNTAVTEQP